MTLILHRGAKEIDYAGLREIETPEPTGSHHPIAHYHVVDLVKHSLTFYGHTIEDEHYGVTEDGMRFFGALTLRSPYGHYTDLIGLRNSADKSFPVGIAFGSRVMVCDNMAFHSETVVKRKHTPRLRFELPGLIASIVEPLGQRRNEQALVFERYQTTPLSPMQADHAIINMFREDIINLQRIGNVLDEWEEPSFDWGEPTAYRLFNAATYALTGRVAENPTLTRKLHRVIDGVCSEIN